MSAQVIYISTRYYPDIEEQYELDKMQEFLTFCHARFDYEYRGIHPEMRKLIKEGVHLTARKRLHIQEPFNEN